MNVIDNLIDNLTGEQRTVIHALIEQALTDMKKGVAKETNVSVLSPTNCVNCGAVIDPNVDHCEYCGTSYKLMGIRCAPKKVSRRELLNRHTKLNAERRARLERDQLQLETELLQAKTKALSDALEIKTLYEDALNAMRAYDRVY